MQFRSACPLNCPDSCGFIVEYAPEKGLKVYGDKEHPITKGFICAKGQALAQRVFSPDRLRFPLLRQGQGFRRISWDEAYELLVQKIKETLEITGPWGIFHHYDYGHNGLLRNLDRRFFQALGGVTEPSGSMCWGAGYRAQELDFGGVFSNSWQDLSKAGLIILWGRDPAVTGTHLIPFLDTARKAGAKVIAINPVRVKSSTFTDEFIRVAPGTDAALALGLGHIILREGWLDWDFVRTYVHGLEEYALKAKEFPPERVAELCGVTVETLRNLAHMFSHARPVTILAGYGLQRYAGGGNTIRAIDALAAITGNIGVPGAGVQYAHQYHRGKFNTLDLPPGRYTSRLLPHPLLAERLFAADPPIRLAFVTRSNPLLQQANSVLWREIWQRIPFKVCFDMVLTETARNSDLLLPVTTIFEEEDFLATSWSPVLLATEKVLEPQGEAKPEPEIFSELARRLGLGEDFPYTPAEWLQYAVEPLQKYGLSLEDLKQKAIYAPYIPEVAWADKSFSTPSGKIELASEQAGKECGSTVADFIPSGSGQDSREYPLFLLTPHPGKALHSQFQEDEDIKLYIHPELAQQLRLNTGDKAIVETIKGELAATVKVSEDIHPKAVLIPEGGSNEGFSVNRLTVGAPSDFGEGIAYYDVRCQIRKRLVD